jgi:hypothetical protein
MKLKKRILKLNTLILAEEGSGKTHLANKIRQFVMDNDVPTLYLDFSDPEVDQVEARFKEENFFYMRFEESDTFNQALEKAVAERRHIYMAVNPNYFSYKRDIQSSISKMLQNPGLLENYYYFFHEISRLNVFYSKFEDFMLYLLNMVNMKKYGLTFLSQPHEIFEDPQLKLLFTFLFIGKCSNADYYNTALLKNMEPNTFYFQYRMNSRTLLFNQVRGDIVYIDA